MKRMTGVVESKVGYGRRPRWRKKRVKRMRDIVDSRRWQKIKKRRKKRIKRMRGVVDNKGGDD